MILAFTLCLHKWSKLVDIKWKVIDISEFFPDLDLKLCCLLLLATNIIDCYLI